MIGAFLARAMVRVPATIEDGVLRSLPDANDSNLGPFQYSTTPNRLELAALPSLRDVPAAQRHELFLGKVEQCNVIYNFENASHRSSKDIKTHALNELLDYVKSNGFLIKEPMWQMVTAMFAKNVFRPVLHFRSGHLELFDLEDDGEEVASEVAWDHIQPVYELFNVVIQNKFLTTSVAESYIDRNFVLCLLDRFSSEDPRELKLLKATLHAIYLKFRNLRTFIRQSVNGVLLQFTYGSKTPFGIAELLEILGSIFSGLASPLKDEYKDSLIRVLIPLHKSVYLGKYHVWLAYCISQLLERDPSLIQVVVTRILRYWPKVNSAKEVIFLDEMGEILETVNDEGFVQIQDKLFHQLAKSIASPHLVVARRALHFWSNETFCNRVRDNIAVILPIMFPSVYEGSNCHWNELLRNTLHDLMVFFMTTNPQLFDDCWYIYIEQSGKTMAQEANREQRWKALRQMADVSKFSYGNKRIP